MSNLTSSAESKKVVWELQVASEQEKEENIALVERAMEGDNSAFAELVDNYRDKLYRVLFFLVNHQEDAMDLLQETFLKAYKSLHKLRAPAAFYSWLTRIAVNLALNTLKKNERVKWHHKQMIEESNAHSESPLEIVQRKELKEQITQLIAQLPDKQRAALVLCDIEGYAYKEIAEILKCRIGTVMSRIHYARSFIRKNLKEYQRDAATSSDQEQAIG